MSARLRVNVIVRIDVGSIVRWVALFVWAIYL